MRCGSLGQFASFFIKTTNIKKTQFITASRRRTPWTDKARLSALQSFIDQAAEDAYKKKHPRIPETNEDILLNSFLPSRCPYCFNGGFIRYGKTGNGIIRYACKSCGRTFTITTGAIFQDHKIPIIEWIEYCLGLFRFQSFSSISKSNKNAFTTTKYWLYRIFLVLDNYQDGIVLDGKVYIDETFYKARKDSIEYKEDGVQYRGLSRSQICIGIGTGSGKAIAFVEGNGKTSGKRTMDAFSAHIKPGSHLVHDEEKSHNRLVQALNPESEEYNARSLKNTGDDENPLAPINRMCFLLKKFLNAHSSFIRDDLQGYLNLFAFIINEGLDPYEKVEKLLSRALHSAKTLNFREKFSN